MAEVYCFRLISNEEKKFFRDIEIDADQTFYDFHDGIQDILSFDKAQLASFFITDNNWNRKVEISLMDMRSGNENDPLIMDETTISSQINQLKDKLVYVFDFFSGRALFIELIEVKDKIKHKKYPLCSNGAGEAPPQIKFISGTNKTSLFTPEDSIEEDDGIEYNDDEIDMEDDFSENENLNGEDTEFKEEF